MVLAAGSCSNGLVCVIQTKENEFKDCNSKDLEFCFCASSSKLNPERFDYEEYGEYDDFLSADDYGIKRKIKWYTSTVSIVYL